MNTVSSRNLFSSGAVAFGLMTLLGCGDDVSTTSTGTGGSASTSSGEGGGPASGSGSGGASCADLNPTDAPATVCSMNGAEQPVTFTNGCATESIEIFWVDAGCLEMSYGVIQPAGTLSINSYVSHPWRAREATTGKLLKDFGATSTTSNAFVVP